MPLYSNPHDYPENKFVSYTWASVLAFVFGFFFEAFVQAALILVVLIGYSCCLNLLIFLLGSCFVLHDLDLCFYA